MLISFLIAATLLVNISLRPVISDMASQIGRQNISLLVNETVFEVLEQDFFDYSSFVKLKYNSMGFVTSVEYDYKTINRLKLNCQELLLNNFAKLGNTKVKIPFGSLLGDLNASGKGPSIKLRLSQSAVPEINIISTFESVGINQTRHEIRLVITAYAQLYLPPKMSDFSCTQEYVLAQTIIVGDIPQGYVTLG
ncbi:MAG: hypothetical protein IJ424_03975 [Oscillospiraceae bacterium]|nr:hypothetical protein [Oscillospiraceae bacterium]